LLCHQKGLLSCGSLLITALFLSGKEGDQSLATKGVKVVASQGIKVGGQVGGQSSWPVTLGGGS